MYEKNTCAKLCSLAKNLCTHSYSKSFNVDYIFLRFYHNYIYSESDKVTYEDFSRWLDIDSNAESLGLSRWLLFPNPNLSLVNKTDTPTFYQTLAGVTHLEELEVVELEKRFWEIANHSASGQVGFFYKIDCLVKLRL